MTQFALGAAIGEAALRTSGGEVKRFGWGAALLGGVVGTLPDLDVLSAPFLTAPQALASHRGISHSILAGALVSPLLALLLRRLFFEYGLSFRRWLVFVWTTLTTHWMLDCLTMYGTQIFQPFSNYPVNIGSIFIVDPLYTAPLLLALVASLWLNRKGGPFDPRPIRIGLLLSTLYLAFTLVSKYTVEGRLRDHWVRHGGSYQQMITVPTPFNSLLFYAYVDTGTDVWVADGSLFDPPDRSPVWQRIPKNVGLLPNLGEGPAGACLLWFSRGFYRLEIQNGQPTFIDLRFGRLKGWLREQDPAGDDYTFLYRLLPAEPAGPYSSFTRPPFERSLRDFPWEDLWSRMWGGELPPEP